MASIDCAGEDGNGHDANSAWAFNVNTAEVRSSAVLAAHNKVPCPACARGCNVSTQQLTNTLNACCCFFALILQSMMHCVAAADAHPAGGGGWRGHRVRLLL